MLSIVIAIGTALGLGLISMIFNSKNNSFTVDITNELNSAKADKIKLLEGKIRILKNKWKFSNSMMLLFLILSILSGIFIADVLDYGMFGGILGGVFFIIFSSYIFIRLSLANKIQKLEIFLGAEKTVAFKNKELNENSRAANQKDEKNSSIESNDRYWQEARNLASGNQKIKINIKNKTIHIKESSGAIIFYILAIIFSLSLSIFLFVTDERFGDNMKDLLIIIFPAIFIISFMIDIRNTVLDFNKMNIKNMFFGYEIYKTKIQNFTKFSRIERNGNGGSSGISYKMNFKYGHTINVGTFTKSSDIQLLEVIGEILKHHKISPKHIG